MKYVESDGSYTHSVGYTYDDINNLTKLVETINGVTHETSYTYDLDNRVTSITNRTIANGTTSGESTTRTYEYDGHSRVNRQVTKHGESTVLTTGFAYLEPTNTTTTGQIEELTVQAAGFDVEYSYEYDDNGNILSVSDGTNETSYVYDSAGQLVRENNQAANKTWTWTYDNAGNILSRSEYGYTKESLEGVTPTDTVNYTYGDAHWRDLLTSYDGQVIYVDTIGNPVSDGTWSYDWHHGRQLERIFGEGPDGYVEVEYTYDANGLRTEKTVTNMVFENVGTRTGLFVCSDGEIRYFTNGQPTYAGLIQDENGDYYYIRSSLVATRNRSYYVTLTNGLLPTGEYMFGADGRMIVDEAYGENGNLFTGLRQDADGEIRYYVNGIPTYAGLVQDEDGDYYYINSSMTAVREQSYYVTMTNGLLPEDTYTFDEDGRMVDPPEAVSTYSTTTYRVLVPDETVTYRYTYNGSSLTQMTAGNDTLYFAYAGGTPMSVTYNNTTYYYVTNLQGDVIAILNTAGTAVVEYTYDAWGNILTTTGTMASTLGEVNPLTYRGYVYDHESGLYYLQSRYYDPELGRFLNADSYASTGQGILGYNMFAYCQNNPVNGYDPCGTCVHNRKFYDCEKCAALWNRVSEWCVDAYCTINSFHQQQAQLQTQIGMQQNEMMANATKKMWNAYQKGYELEQEAIMLQGKLNLDMFDSPEDIERSIDIIEATGGFSIAVCEVAKIVIVGNPSVGAVVVALAGVLWAGRAIYRACQ